VLRVAGTLAGLLLATLLAHWAMGDAWLRLLLLAALCVGFRLTVTVHYGIGVALLTGLVVVLLSFEGMAPADAIHARVVATLAGSALALAAYALWPIAMLHGWGTSGGDASSVWMLTVNLVCVASVLAALTFRLTHRDDDGRARRTANAKPPRTDHNGWVGAQS